MWYGRRPHSWVAFLACAVFLFGGEHAFPQARQAQGQLRATAVVQSSIAIAFDSSGTPVIFSANIGNGESSSAEAVMLAFVTIEAPLEMGQPIFATATRCKADEHDLPEPTYGKTTMLCTPPLKQISEKQVVANGSRISPYGGW
jgi:hypothetical protein